MKDQERTQILRDHLGQWFFNLWVEAPQGVTCQRFILQFVTVAKLPIMKYCQNNFLYLEVTTTWGTVFKGQSIGKGENHWSRSCRINLDHFLMMCLHRNEDTHLRNSQGTLRPQGALWANVQVSRYCWFVITLSVMDALVVFPFFVPKFPRWLLMCARPLAPLRPSWNWISMGHCLHSWFAICFR